MVFYSDIYNIYSTQKYMASVLDDGHTELAKRQPLFHGAQKTEMHTSGGDKCFFQLALLGDRPPPKRNGLKQPSFRLVDSGGQHPGRGPGSAQRLFCGSLLAPQAAGVPGQLPRCCRVYTAGKLFKALCNFRFLCLISVFSSHRSSLRNIKKVLDSVENFILAG